MDADVPCSGAVCPDCGKDGVLAYCPHCGQRRIDGPLRLGQWLRESFESWTSLEGRVPRTLWSLATGPGRTAREWIDGKRTRYSNPFRLVLASSALWFLAQSVVSTGSSEQIDRIIEYGQLLNLVLIPPTAFVVHGAFARTRFTFTEHLVLVCFVVSFAFLWRTVLVLASPLGLPEGPINTADGVAFLLLNLWAFAQFHRDRCSRTMLLIRSFLALVAVVITSQLGAALFLHWLQG